MTSMSKEPAHTHPSRSPESEGRGDMAERILSEQLPIVVTELLSKVLAIKEGETFLYSDTEGNLDERPGYGLGLYYQDTRFLSRFRMRAIAGRVYERIRIKNYNSFPVALDVDLEFGADFADIFEVRGLARDVSGHYDPPRVEDRAAEFSYLGQDNIRRTTRIDFAHRPARLEVRGDLVEASFRVHLAAHETKLVSMTMETRVGDIPLAEKEFDAAVHELRRSYEDWERSCTQIRTDNELFDQLLTRGLRDLRALYTKMDGNGIVAAGIPWFVAPFGRDTLITSHQLLMVNPQPARESLRILAAKQGTE